MVESQTLIGAAVHEPISPPAKKPRATNPTNKPLKTRTMEPNEDWDMEQASTKEDVLGR